MPDLTQSDRLRELRTVFPSNTREVLTIELRQTAAPKSTLLDIVIVAAHSGDIYELNTLVCDILDQLNDSMPGRFTSIRFSVISYTEGGAPDTLMVTAAFTVLAGHVTAEGFWLTQFTGAFGLTLIDNYGAIVMGAQFVYRENATRMMLLITNKESHENHKTLAQAKYYLLREGIIFHLLYTGDPLTSYAELVDITRGQAFTATLHADKVAAAVGIILTDDEELEPPVYLVNDNANFAAKLEDDTDVIFLQRSFVLDPFTSGEEGAVGIPLTIDNTDLAVSRYTQRVRGSGVPVEVLVRIYDDSDRTGPQNDPPLRLYASEFEARGSVVSCQLSWIDLHNASFPNVFYTPTLCPSLQ